ncbi:MAG: hypothetical protein ACRDJN_31950, partial [Chloroflexota bacterium]
RYSFRPPASLDGPIRSGAAAHRFLSDSLTTLADIEASAVEAFRAHPEADRRVQIDDALGRLSRRLGTTLPASPPWAVQNVRIAVALWLQEQTPDHERHAQ